MLAQPVSVRECISYDLYDVIVIIMSWLAAIISILLVVRFWRIFVPLAVVSAIGGALLVLLFYIYHTRTAQNQTQESQARVANAQANPVINRAWEVKTERDPASGLEVPRIAGILSEDGLCRLQVERRLSGEEAATIYCDDLKLHRTSQLEIKFDNKSVSNRIEVLSNDSGDAIHMFPDKTPLLGQWAYRQFLKDLISSRKVAVKVAPKGLSTLWVVFSLAGCEEALIKIGTAVREDPKATDIFQEILEAR